MDAIDKDWKRRTGIQSARRWFLGTGAAWAALVILFVVAAGATLSQLPDGIGRNLAISLGISIILWIAPMTLVLTALGLAVAIYSLGYLLMFLGAIFTETTLADVLESLVESLRTIAPVMMAVLGRMAWFLAPGLRDLYRRLRVAQGAEPPRPEDSCPCGSRLHYKDCCGKPLTPSEEAGLSAPAARIPTDTKG